MLLDTCVCGAHPTEGPFINLNPHVVIICSKCGTGSLMTNRRRDEVEAWYSSGRYHEDTSRHENVTPYAERYDHDLDVAQVRISEYLQRFIRGGLEGKKLLDVGAANGAFVDFCNSIGLESVGIEPDPRFADGQVTTDTLHTLRPGPEFDIITMHDVLEHLVDPQAELILARDKLRSGGHLVIEVPNIFDRSDDNAYRHIKAEHLWYFTHTQLARMFGRAGMIIEAQWRPIPGKMVFVGRLL